VFTPPGVCKPSLPLLEFGLKFGSPSFHHKLTNNPPQRLVVVSTPTPFHSLFIIPLFTPDLKSSFVPLPSVATILLRIIV
jgi:hypothetical protein